MNMPVFLKSKTLAFVFALVLFLPIIAAANQSHSFAYSKDQHGPAQQFYSVNQSLVPDATRENFWSPKMIWPVSNPTISSGFGHRPAACGACSTDHRGVDFTPGHGSQIFAAMTGVVVQSVNYGSYGTTVVIEHPNGWKTLYAHMIPGSQTVSAGERVVQGKVIGLVGNSGTSTGSHLHFEIIINGVQKNPVPILNELTKG